MLKISGQKKKIPISLVRPSLQGHKILVDARMVDKKMHGIARYTTILIREFSKFGHQVDIIITNDAALETIGKGFINGFIKCKYPFTDKRSPFELQKLDYSQYDVVHFTSFMVPPRPVRNTVITIHDLTHLTSYKNLKHKIYYNTVLKSALKNCRYVITPSDATRRELIDRMNIPEEKVITSRVGVEESWFNETVTTAYDESSFACVTNFKPHKNTKTLLKAFNHLWENGHQLKLKLVSNTSLDPKEMGELSKDIINCKNIEIIRNPDDDELKRVYKSSTALISPSFSEGFNFPVAEALILGKPVILSSLQAHKEFESKNLYYYGAPEDYLSLAERVLDVVRLEQNNSNRGHNVKTSTQFAYDVMQVYKLIAESKDQSQSGDQ